MKNTVYIALAFILSVIFVKCDNMDGDICLSNQNSVQASLYSAYSPDDKDTVLTDLYVQGVGNDSLLYDSVATSSLFLPLAMHTDTTAYRIKVKALLDTIWFVYKRDLSYISGNCGLTMNIEIDTVFFTGRFIDSVAINYPYILYNENIENVKIYIN